MTEISNECYSHDHLNYSLQYDVILAFLVSILKESHGHDNVSWVEGRDTYLANCDRSLRYLVTQ